MLSRTFETVKLFTMIVRKKIVCLLAIMLLTTVSTFAQKVIYSEPDREDNRSTNFEVVGKLEGNNIIYKSYRDIHFIAVYNAQMVMVEKNKLDFLPDKIINADFLAYQDFFYMFYQYQRKSIVYSMAVKLNSKGKKVGEPMELDTTDINFFASNKLYSVINSDDKQKIMTYKVNNKNDKNHIITTVLFNKNLELIQKSIVGVPMPGRNDFLTDFQLDNDGDMVFVRAEGTTQNDNINKLSLFTKKATSNTIAFNDIKMAGLFLDGVTIKVDNYNKRYLVTSFYAKQRRGNIDGLFCHIWDKVQAKEITTTYIIFNDELRAEARGENSVKGAFNDYFLHNIIMKQDGGFIIAAEAAYTSTRGGANNSRWDIWNGSPYWGGGVGNGFYGFGNSMNTGFGNSGNRWNSFSNVTRYYAENIAVLSYDANAKLEWSNIVNKSQYDDNSDNLIGYSLVNTGDQLHFLFNSQEKRNTFLTDQNISPEGQIVRNPTLKNLDKGYEFMPRFAKQVTARQVIIPCQYRNYICFAKIEL